GRQPVHGADARRVADDERRAGGDREADRLGLEREAGARARGDADRAAVRCADRGANRRELVLGLERADAEVTVARELMEQRRGRRDRVGAEDDLAIRELAGGREAECERLAAAHAAILAG